MKKELKNIRIVSENGEAVLLTKQRYYCLIQTLDILARDPQEIERRRRGARKSTFGRE